MTREDIDRIASEYFDDKESEHEMDEVFDLAKKALEERKDDMLDKIKTEIEEIEKDYGFDKATKYGNKNAEQQNLSYSTMMMYEIAYIFDDIKDIIDKYRESEE